MPQKIFLQCLFLKALKVLKVSFAFFQLNNCSSEFDQVFHHRITDLNFMPHGIHRREKEHESLSTKRFHDPGKLKVIKIYRDISGQNSVYSLFLSEI